MITPQILPRTSNGVTGSLPRTPEQFLPPMPERKLIPAAAAGLYAVASGIHAAVGIGCCRCRARSPAANTSTTSAAESATAEAVKAAIAAAAANAAPVAAAPAPPAAAPAPLRRR
jgi:hypothetical protein